MKTTTVHKLIAAARADGVLFRIGGDAVLLRGPADARQRWTEELRPVKHLVLQALRDEVEAQAERSAILEHDAGLDRDLADLLARGDASAGGVDWQQYRLQPAASLSTHWLVEQRDGRFTLLVCSSPTDRADVLRGARYLSAVPLDSAAQAARDAGRDQLGNPENHK